MGICCGRYNRDDDESFIDNEFSSSCSGPVGPIVSENTGYYGDYQENLSKTQHDENQIKPSSTTRESIQSISIKPGNENRATNHDKPIIICTADTSSTRPLDTNFNATPQLDAPNDFVERKFEKWEWEPQTLFEKKHLETNIVEPANISKLVDKENLEPDIKNEKQTNFLNPSNSPELFKKENLEADTINETQTAVLGGLNSPRLELFKEETLETEKKKEEITNFHDRLTKHKVERNLELINDLRAAFNLNHLGTFPESPYKEEKLEAIKYIEVEDTFRQSNKPYFRISKISAVNNIFLELHYKINMEIYKKRYPEQLLDDRIVFHGTKLEFLNRICTYNFDRSKVCTHKFGHGVSFASYSSYATHYHHDNKYNNRKVMIIAKALLEHMLPIGNYNTIVPLEPFYTSRNKNGSVIVKYDDASFYPLYIVYYRGLHPQNRPLRH